MADIFGVESTDLTASVFSSLSLSSGTGKLFKKYAQFVDSTVRRRRDILMSDEERDDMKELANELWTVHDNLAEDDGDGDAAGAEDD